MEQTQSGFNVLASAVAQAIQELDAQNYGNARRILDNALKNTKETYIVNKHTIYDAAK